jgi:hypothetical protein
MIVRLTRWWRGRRTRGHPVDDPFTDAMQLRYRQQAIRRTLAQIRAENARQAGS